MTIYLKGRGALSNPANRFAAAQVDEVDDGWALQEVPDSIATQIRAERARTIITTNQSPDLPFEQSINPYRGCEHGCPYCYARPSHAYMDLSPGLDFETHLFYKADAATLLRAELAKRNYVCKPITVGANTDPYQPLEKRLKVTRSILQVLRDTHHPVTLITKGSLIVRDLDLLSELAREGLVNVFVTVTTLDDDTKRLLEPRAAAPAARLRIIRRLTEIGVNVGVMVAPVIPAITDHELEQVLGAAAEAGARRAGYVILRLPHELKILFREWLQAHYPARAAHVMSVIQSMRGGQDNDPRFGTRMRGMGPFADLLRRRFQLACTRNGLARGAAPPLPTGLFRPPPCNWGQMDLGL
ncbi:MAG TPA: PA0069 family radical SAM protein [Steroidobacteraceae bacterium]